MPPITVFTGLVSAPSRGISGLRPLGIPDAEPVLTGAELDTLPEGERVERIARTTVFARVSPEHKVRIVQALRQAGQVVAMTGDGVNDAAATPPLWARPSRHGCSSPGGRRSGSEHTTRETGHLRRLLTSTFHPFTGRSPGVRHPLPDAGQATDGKRMPRFRSCSVQ
ncbi:HAD family hydrolase [Streptomyces sp. PSAA01]|uniref:HAD family hydrolase n=1 Tax=Streptomyces sp. PSAA01 TaxID=2912762 RepID=UPI0027E2204F|nr:HAD family hydrolase [Streptomyces sp. PSAA01]